MTDSKLPTKKELKKLVNENGAFTQMEINVTSTKASGKNEVTFSGVASNSDLNRNGYIIDANAWTDAIAEYMNNPVILLQHDMDKPIGRATSARVENDELRVNGVLYKDQMDAASWAALQNGTLKGLSTGHITKAAAFRNSETGETVPEDEVGEKGKPSWGEVVFSGAWEMVVTALEWLEFSLVTIPANRKSMITEKNALGASQDAKLKVALKNGAAVDEDKWNEEDLTEKVEDNAPEDAAEEVAEETTEEVEETPETPEPEVAAEETEEVETVDETSTPEEDGETPETPEETEPEDAEVVETVDETDETPEETAEEIETTEVVEPELREMVKHLAKNLMVNENKVENIESKQSEVDVNALIETAVEKSSSELNAKISEMAKVITALSTKLDRHDSILTKTVTNRPQVVVNGNTPNVAKKKMPRFA